jgi:predicted nucleic acid-binding protein
MNDGPSLYLDTSVVLRATLEHGLTPEIEGRIGAAPLLVTSRISLVEAARAFHRIRTGARVEEGLLGEAIRGVESLWARCEIWELTPRVCERASLIRPELPLRTLDALHLATYLLARERIEGLELLTADRRLEEAAAGL